MDTQQLIQQFLPQDVWEIAGNFLIPEQFIQQMPDLIELVLRSRSISEDEEKQSWFNLLPIMNDEQIQKLHDILDKEKQKLAEIEEKYNKKKMEIKKKYLMRWQNMGYIKKMEELKEKEASHAEQDQEDAEALLDGL